MSFTDNFVLYHTIDEHTREMFYFQYFDGRIVINEYELQKRETTRHKYKAYNAMVNTYKRHNRRDFPKKRESIIIPASIQEAAINYIKDQIKITED